jgi:hypothetical protein
MAATPGVAEFRQVNIARNSHSTVPFPDSHGPELTLPHRRDLGCEVGGHETENGIIGSSMVESAAMRGHPSCEPGCLWRQNPTTRLKFVLWLFYSRLLSKSSFYIL